jgi:probable rRNA maturation factor
VPAEPQFGINVLVKKGYEDLTDVDWLTDLAVKALESEGVARPAELELVITDDQEIRRLNKRFAGEDCATDVLSFPVELTELEEAGYVAPPHQVRHLGEIVISYETACRQATDSGGEVNHEMAHLLFHGILHVLGYDHVETEEERVMRTKEEELLGGTLQGVHD